MNPELAFNAYVFLPNALNLAENRMQIDYAVQLGSTREQVAALHSRLLAPQPSQILPFLAALSPQEKSLLIGVGTLVLGSMDDEELAALTGLPRAEMEEVLNFVCATDTEEA